MIENFLKQLCEELSGKKESLIKSKLVELGIDPEVYEQDMIYGRRRFNPLIIEVHEGFGELVYYNDGTDNGLFVIGFTEMESPPYSFETDFKITASFGVISEEPERYKIKPRLS